MSFQEVLDGLNSQVKENFLRSNGFDEQRWTELLALNYDEKTLASLAVIGFTQNERNELEDIVGYTYDSLKQMSQDQEFVARLNSFILTPRGADDKLGTFHLGPHESALMYGKKLHHILFPASLLTSPGRNQDIAMLTLAHEIGHAFSQFTTTKEGEESAADYGDKSCLSEAEALNYQFKVMKNIFPVARVERYQQLFWRDNVEDPTTENLYNLISGFLTDEEPPPLNNLQEIARVAGKDMAVSSFGGTNVYFTYDEFYKWEWISGPVPMNCRG